MAFLSSFCTMIVFHWAFLNNTYIFTTVLEKKYGLFHIIVNLLYTVVLSVVTKNFTKLTKIITTLTETITKLTETITIQKFIENRISLKTVFLQIKRKNIVFYQTNHILSNKIQKIHIFDNFP